MTDSEKTVSAEPDGKNITEKSGNREQLPVYLFHQGTNYRAYELLGSHIVHEPDGDTAIFRVWAPNADNVFLCGDFNDWNRVSHPLSRISAQGLWGLSIPVSEFGKGRKYKYAIVRGGVTRLKADPYAVYSETLSDTASILHELAPEWNGGAWMKSRASRDVLRSPMNIYEIHLGSWRTRDGMSTVSGEGYLNYREIADMLIPYVKRMGYTHVELMPIMEHPYDGSWGYQICGYYAPTSRFGTPEDFAYFVDRLHCEGIGVILDWVPAHFPKDAHGLYEFDGSPLYEYQGFDRIEHEGWGTRCFDVGRNEVQCFLISNALYWLNEFHIDGLRVDAVASMLYLDYDRRPGEWIPNVHGGHENLEAIAFFKKLNSIIKQQVPDAMMIAEESTAWAALTKPVEDGGLGFTFKWNMGWANDMFEYVATDPIFRKHQHSKLNFSLMYAFGENYILPVSHDEVVHGKKSLLDKMFGAYDDKFAGMRVFLCHMIAHPGKKMTFMGCEYGQFREWDYANQLEWFMTDYDMHSKLWSFTSALNHFYLRTPALWENDINWDGFRWVSADAAEDNVIAYERIAGDGSRLLCVFNFSGAMRTGYPLKVSGHWRTVFSSDDEKWGGRGLLPPEHLNALRGMLYIDLPPLSAVYLESEPAEDTVKIEEPRKAQSRKA